MINITLAQLNFKIGDFEYNYQKIIHTIQHHHNNTDIVVFSELALSGYYPKDLIERPGFVESQQDYLNQLVESSKSHQTAIIIGYIRPTAQDIQNTNNAKPFRNSLCLIHQGNILYHYDKQLLPVYNIFDEARHFTPGNTLGCFDFKNHKLGFLICEDAWKSESCNLHPTNPIKQLSAAKPDAVIIINGSPSNVGKQQDRLNKFSDLAKTLQTPILYCNQMGGHDDLIFDGASFCISDNGEYLGSLKSFEEDSGIAQLSHKNLTLKAGFAHTPPISDLDLFYHQTILGLRDYVQKCGFPSVVIGLSGGIDSALTLALATLALGKDSVSAIAMPSRYSSQHSIDDAKTLCDNLNIKLHIVSIEPEFSLACERFEQSFHEPIKSITAQNIQARIRGRILMSFSNQYGALVLSTGNKSELSVGYTTLYGDMTGGLNIIGDLYKTEVYALANAINTKHQKLLIPQNIISKAPSAELMPNQKDTDNLPPYDILDPILRLYIEGDLLPDNQKQACQDTLKSLDPNLIKSVYQMVDRAEFKRKQASPIIRIQRRGFGMGRQFPIAADFNL